MTYAINCYHFKYVSDSWIAQLYACVDACKYLGMYAYRLACINKNHLYTYGRNSHLSTVDARLLKNRMHLTEYEK
jgi:hypothetical protein